MAWWETERIKAFTMALIKNYMDLSGRSAFTYRDLRIHYYRNYADHTYDWHSIERAIRRLAQEGKLTRIRAGKKVYFGFTYEGLAEAQKQGVVA